MPWGITEHISHLQKLLEPGVIGNYNSFEVTEVFGAAASSGPGCARSKNGS